MGGGLTENSVLGQNGITTDALAPLKTGKQDSAAVRAQHGPNGQLNILTPLSSGLSNQLNPINTTKNVVAGQKHLRGSSVDAANHVADIRTKMQSIVKGRDQSVRISRINGDELAQHNSVIEYGDKSKGIASELDSLSINGRHN